MPRAVIAVVVPVYGQGAPSRQDPGGLIGLGRAWPIDRAVSGLPPHLREEPINVRRLRYSSLSRCLRGCLVDVAGCKTKRPFTASWIHGSTTAVALLRSPTERSNLVLPHSWYGHPAFLVRDRLPGPCVPEVAVVRTGGSPTAGKRAMAGTGFAKVWRTAVMTSTLPNARRDRTLKTVLTRDRRYHGPGRHDGLDPQRGGLRVVMSRQGRSSTIADFRMREADAYFPSVPESADARRATMRSYPPVSAAFGGGTRARQLVRIEASVRPATRLPMGPRIRPARFRDRRPGRRGSNGWMGPGQYPSVALRPTPPRRAARGAQRRPVVGAIRRNVRTAGEPRILRHGLSDECKSSRCGATIPAALRAALNVLPHVGPCILRDVRARVGGTRNLAIDLHGLDGSVTTPTSSPYHDKG